MQRAAILASATPVAFDTNGTVREARGLTSRMKIVASPCSSVWIANCVFIKPTTFSSRAICATCTRNASCTAGGSEYGGSEHDESPECTPASSICSMMPPISTLPWASATTSTSTSTALSRKRSSSTGESFDTRTASVM